MAPKRETALELWGKELAHAREAARMTGRQLADAMHVVPSTVSQWESGKRKPHLEDLERIEALLGTNGYLQRLRTKWVSREIPTEWTDKWIAAEARATMVQNFELFVIPGLLQTEDYYASPGSLCRCWLMVGVASSLVVALSGAGLVSASPL
jgi:transcriptional regulator with XRE-family HTH domain